MDIENYALQHVAPKRCWVNGNRHYETPDGMKLPGVTTILAKTRVDPPALKAWKDRATPADLAKAEIAREEGAKRGDEFHAMLEQYLLHDKLGSGCWWKSVARFLPRIDHVGLVESAIWHPVYRYAGTLDLLAVVDGVWTLVDWKTASKPKRREWIEDYELQAAAYCAGVRRAYGPIVDRALIVIALEDRPAQIVEVTAGELRVRWESFKARCRTFHELT